MERIRVNHEWGALKEVILGIGDGAVIPSWWEGFLKYTAEPEVLQLMKKHGGERLSDIDPELAAGLKGQVDGLARLLEDKGVKVHRSHLLTPECQEYLANILRGGFLLFSRDPILVIGNNVIETALQVPFRRKERYSIRPVLESVLKGSNATLISMPPASPRLPKEEGETDPFLEGGDVLLNGHEIYVGCSGRASNQAGVKWLQDFLGPEYSVHKVELKSDVLHLDCALALVRPGLAIRCPEWIPGGLPDSLGDFEFVDIDEEEAKKLGANVLVFDDKTVIVDEQHHRIAGELREKGQEVITIPYDVVSSFGGAFRCSHHPLRRESKLE